MHHPIKTAILSFGMSGKIFHAPFLEMHEGFALTSVLERTDKKAHLYYPTIKSYSSIDELLADSQIELVVVNTPNATHFDYALKALRAGKHVLLEKAFTINSQQAKELYLEAERLNRWILPYQNRRFDSDFLSVKEVIESGKLGRLVEMHVRFDRYRTSIGPKLAKELPVPGSGLMYDLCPHLLDSVLSVFGNPLSWKKTLGHFREKTQVDDYVHIHLTYPNEFQVFVTASMLVADAQPAYVLHGTKGTFIKYRADVQEKQLLEGINPDNHLYGKENVGMEGILTTISEDGIKSQEKVASIKSTYLHLFESVYQTIREHKSYPITPEQIIQQLEILEE